MTSRSKSASKAPQRGVFSRRKAFPFLDFFAGSGLASEGAKPFFSTVWANDISERKARVYKANHPTDSFVHGSIEEVSGAELPAAAVSWASFPCQDLSLAGKLGGIGASRSGLVWHWLRITDEMRDRPPILVAENVAGLLSASAGRHYRALHEELERRGYRVGPMVLDAVMWLPQSRPRVFIVAAAKGINLDGLVSAGPTWAQPGAVSRAVSGLQDVVWWKLPTPPARQSDLASVIEFDAPCDDPEIAKKNFSLIAPKHVITLRSAVKNGLRVVPGYKRTRSQGQVLELRFDGVAGCLRTPEGGSSRQHLVIPRYNRLGRNGRYDTRTLTVRETARLMGAPDTFRLPGSYNDGYAAMGDAVVVPVVRHLAEHLLYPLAKRANGKA